MAEEQTGQERTEEPTLRRLQEARRKGQVPRSRELNTLLTLSLAALGLILLGPGMVREFAALARSSWAFNTQTLATVHGLPMHLLDTGLAALLVLTPFFLVSVVAALLGPMLMGGWTFSVQALTFSWDKIDPVKGLARVFSLKGLLELAKALLKFVLILLVTGVLFASFFHDLLHLGGLGAVAASLRSVHVLLMTLLLLSLTMILLAVLDVPFELWNHRRKLRMTKQEVREEMKETDGRPEVRQRIRAMQRKASQQRMMEAVPTADVVITNPTHYAVALTYQEGGSGAPRVVAKGRDAVALRIRQRAQAAGVAIFEAPALARALYVSTELNSEIPASLYLAVARVLAYVFQLRRSAPTDYVPAPEGLEVPPEYDEQLKRGAARGNR
jgi:flagellar biosynthetic protein FlhB